MIVVTVMAAAWLGLGLVFTAGAVSRHVVRYGWESEPTMGWPAFILLSVVCWPITLVIRDEDQ